MDGGEKNARDPAHHLDQLYPIRLAAPLEKPK
jgi:hypothetical protein